MVVCAAYSEPGRGILQERQVEVLPANVLIVETHGVGLQLRRSSLGRCVLGVTFSLLFSFGSLFVRTNSRGCNKIHKNEFVNVRARWWMIEKLQARFTLPMLRGC